MRSIINTISFILHHPLNRNNKTVALARFLRWQLGARVLPGDVAVPFVDSTRLLVRAGITGATGNVYCGLHEFNDMALVLHSLRPGDVFADIGANVGSYTVLAAGAAGAKCLSFEPHPTTYCRLADNIRLNSIESLCIAKNIALGSAPKSLSFTASLDTANHVVSRGETVKDVITVPVEPLDAVVKGQTVNVIKIDVEGYETEVLNGGSSTFQNPSLIAVIMELNGSGHRYGYDEVLLHNRMLKWGFEPATYDPLRRQVYPHRARSSTEGNTLYVRDLNALRERVCSAPTHTVLNQTI